MAPPEPDNQPDVAPSTGRRRYNSPLRREQSARTRERIISAGAELVHGFTTWDWKNLNARAVAKRAGVSERTVHRHFATERHLRDAVLERLVEESGVQLEDLELDQVATTTARTFRYLSSFAVEPPKVETPGMAAIDRHRREAVLEAVSRAAPDWSDHSRQMAAAVLDVLWNVPTYERLLSSWEFDSEEAVSAITWVIGLIEEAIRQDRPPDT